LLPDGQATSRPPCFPAGGRSCQQPTSQDQGQHAQIPARGLQHATMINVARAYEAFRSPNGPYVDEDGEGSGSDQAAFLRPRSGRSDRAHCPVRGADARAADFERPIRGAVTRPALAAVRVGTSGVAGKMTRREAARSAR
jgi:hypothetical protein